MTDIERRYWIDTYHEFEKLVENCGDSAMILCGMDGVKFRWGDWADVQCEHYGMDYKGATFEVSYDEDMHLSLEPVFEIGTDIKGRPIEIDINDLEEEKI